MKSCSATLVEIPKSSKSQNLHKCGVLWTVEAMVGLEGLEGLQCLDTKIPNSSNPLNHQSPSYTRTSFHSSTPSHRLICKSPAHVWFKIVECEAKVTERLRSLRRVRTQKLEFFFIFNKFCIFNYILVLFVHSSH